MEDAGGLARTLDTLTGWWWSLVRAVGLYAASPRAQCTLAVTACAVSLAAVPTMPLWAAYLLLLATTGLLFTDTGAFIH